MTRRHSFSNGAPAISGKTSTYFLPSKTGRGRPKTFSAAALT